MQSFIIGCTAALLYLLVSMRAVIGQFSGRTLLYGTGSPSSIYEQLFKCCYVTRAICIFIRICMGENNDCFCNL